MLIEDLPRLSDEERDALGDGYIAMQGVPAFSIDDLVAERIAALKAMRLAAGDLKAFAVAAAREAELAAQIRRMRMRHLVAHDADNNGRAIAAPDVLTPTVPCSNPETCR